MAFLTTTGHEVVQNKRKIDAGMNGYMEVYGTAEFSTSDTTGTIATGFSVIEHVSITAAASCGAGEYFYWTQSGGLVTIGRVTGTTSGLKISFVIRGH